MKSGSQSGTYMKCLYILEEFPRNWKTTVHQNVVPKKFHTQKIRCHAWKTVRTTMQCVVVLQSWEEVNEK